ncbi:pyrroline-5-carboxylate reductase [Sphingomonas sp. SUN039]|uniref:pyrroline-5-carboxylate reductase family protein n=1 Tax=Sphingomonas sp. SUN039 TaxID=2937787 RepID=UPI0021647795|nr:pyrroline-5-carboxylate reductase [Sphingomonas sp. SUN039]UVO54586.1 pyrroline-5-carboxylate reductase [Sphingomonas sp. SUN039]
MSTDRFWLIGCGAMAGAMLSRWLATGMDPARVTVIDPALPHFDGVRAVATLPDESPPAMLMLGVKPQMLGDIAPVVARATGPETVVLSILAGTRHAKLVEAFPHAHRVVRVMPNLPVAIGEGAVALHAPGADRAGITALMAPLGLVEWIDDEGLFDAVTALSGSGPALVYRFAQALAEGGAAMGLSPDMADRLARATVAGAASLAKASPEPLGVLADRVASKGGSTRVGLDVLDEGAALNALVAAALKAAQARNRELGNG